MAWKVYQLVFKARSPVHVGWHTLGYIKLTRPYVIGRAVWGAITANLARCGLHNRGFGDYDGIGKLLLSKVLASYLYPAVDPDKPMLPKFTDEGFKLGEYSRAEFERAFIRSFGQTGVLPSTNTAEDETLHESEFITPMIEDGGAGEKRDVFFTGYLLLNNQAEYEKMRVTWEELLPALRDLFVGGDRKYGWGWLTLDSSRTKEVLAKKLFGYQLDLNGDYIQLTIPRAQPIPAHLAIGSPAFVCMRGDVEPLVGRDWGIVQSTDGQEISGFGRCITKAKLCWMPGSVVEEGMKFRIGAFGLLSTV